MRWTSIKYISIVNSIKTNQSLRIFSKKNIYFCDLSPSASKSRARVLGIQFTVCRLVERLSDKLYSENVQYHDSGYHVPSLIRTLSILVPLQSSKLSQEKGIFDRYGIFIDFENPEMNWKQVGSLIK